MSNLQGAELPFGGNATEPARPTEVAEPRPSSPPGRPVGRPVIPDEERLSSKVSFRLNHQERASLDLAAKARGLCTSDYVREAALCELRRLGVVR